MTDGRQVVVVGGGLAGLTAACELIERGCNVTILDKEYHLGGNSSKATSGIAAPGSLLQQESGIDGDSIEAMARDAGEVDSAVYSHLENGVSDLAWLSTSIGFDGNLVLRHAPGHSVARIISTDTHFPGVVMSVKTIKALELLSSRHPERVRIENLATVTSLIRSEEDPTQVVGVTYTKGGETLEARGAVVMATGGYAGNLAPEGLLAKHRSDLVGLPTTNDPRASGDGLIMAMEAGANVADLDKVHTLPTAIVRPGQEKATLKYVLSDTLLGAGGILLDGDGNRFCDELASADARTAAMINAKGPFHIVIGETAAARCKWLADAYTEKGVMKLVSNADQLSKHICVSSVGLASTLLTYSNVAATHASGDLCDVVAKKHFLLGAAKRMFCGKTLEKDEKIIDINDNMYVATVTPAVYSCGGGLVVEEDSSVQGLKGLFAAGEVTAARSQNLWSMTGVPLLHAITSGRSAGRAAAGSFGEDVGAMPDIKSLIVSASINNMMDVEHKEEGQEQEQEEAEKTLESMTEDDLREELKKLREGGVPAAGGGDAAPPAEEEPKGIPLSEVAKHNKHGDAWVAINGKVYDVTLWIDIHPGGVQAITAFIGTDASDEWNTIHKPGTVQKQEYPQNGGRGPRYLGDLLGGGSGGGAPQAAVDTSDPPPEGEGAVGGWIGAFLYMAYNWLRLIFKTVFFTGNFHVTGDRQGTVRSAMFLVLFIVIHAVGNLELYLGKLEYNGYAYFYERLYWTGFGLPANFVEEYLAICLFVHVCVALRRSYEITINYCLHTGKWRMLLTGLMTLSFLIVHVQDFRFAKADMVPLRPPPYYFSFDGALSGRFWFETEESGIEPVMVRDVAGLVIQNFQSLWNCLYYTFFICMFMVHIYTGWAKLSPSEVFFLPTGHVKRVSNIGQAFIVCLGAIYLSFPWYIYFTGMNGIPA